MPSPFPGIDPFIEGQEWEDFHLSLIGASREALTAELRPRYIVRVERRKYLEHETPEQPRESYLTVRERETRAIVTVIEVLSPSNKRPGSDGRREYLNKRETVIQSDAHLIELDLLRGGARLPTVEPLPPGDFFAFVCRQQQRWKAEVYAWSLRDPLPSIPIPLTDGDADTRLELAEVFDTTYDRAGYDYSLDYARDIKPALNTEDAAWVNERLEAHGGRTA